jgi:hypothetical protein
MNNSERITMLFYLADLNWEFLTHRGDPHCKISDKLVLEINDDRKMYLRCEACGSKTHFDDKEPQSFGNANMQPWLFDMPAPKEFRSDGQAKIRKVNDTLVYSPVTASALVIPPESRIRRGTPVDLLYRNTNDREQIAAMSDRIESAKTGLQRRKAEALLDHLAKKYRCSLEDIKSAAEEIDRGYPYYGQAFSNSRLFEDEYKAFLDEINPFDDEDFVTHHYTPQWREFTKEKKFSAVLRHRADVIGELVKVDRLKEVAVLNSRIFRN